MSVAGLANSARLWVYFSRVAPWSSGLGRLVFSQEDGGSNPPGVTIPSRISSDIPKEEPLYLPRRARDLDISYQGPPQPPSPLSIPLSA